VVSASGRGQSGFRRDGFFLGYEMSFAAEESMRRRRLAGKKERS